MEHTQSDPELNPIEIKKDIYREQLKDGTNEIFMGVMLFIIVGMLSQSLNLVIAVLMMVFILPVMQKKIKEKFTYPRIGYVKFKSEKDDFKISEFILFLVIIIGITVASFYLLVEDKENIDNIYKVIPIFFGLVMYGPSQELVKKSGLKVYWLLFIFSLVSGIYWSLKTIDNPIYKRFDAISMHLLLLGLILIVLGFTIMATFLRLPILEDEDLDD